MNAFPFHMTRLTLQRTGAALVALGLAPSLWFGVNGCCTFPQESKNGASVAAFEPESPNPLYVQNVDSTELWDAVVDVLDNYYEIDFETPIRSYERQGENGQVYSYRTEGRLDTKPSIMGGVMEPWRKNGAECGERWFATFQTVRTSAVVRVVPEGSGYFIYLSVYDEIEDMPKPIGSAIEYDLRYDDDMTQLEQAVGERQRSKGWIPIGRDTDLETRILKELAWRVGVDRAVLHAGADANLKP